MASPSCSKSRLMELGHLQIPPKGLDSTNGTTTNNNNNNMNKDQNKQNVGMGGCCECSCGSSKNIKGENGKKSGVAPTSPFPSSSTISHGRHLPQRKSNNHPTTTVDISSAPQTSFLSNFGSSVYSANSFLWSWFAADHKKQNLISNYRHEKEEGSGTEKDDYSPAAKFCELNL